MLRLPRHTGGLAAVVLGTLLAALAAAPPAGAARVGEPAPDFAAPRWLNSPPLTLASERGKAVLVYFWTFGCHNCRAVQPHVQAWYDAYRERGLQVVAVHAPEFAYERDLDNLRGYVAEHGIDYPVAVDNDFAVWRRYRNHYWPVLYLIDRDGVLRYVHIGEGAYGRTRGWIERVLGEAAED
jgi:thiol-disulfide isomerase/thioredoxin